MSSAELAALEDLWSSGEADGGSEDNAYQPLAARLSEALGAQINVSKAIPAPVTSYRIEIRNQTIERLVLTDCGPGYWGANGKCIACSKGTYKPDGSVSECLSCPPGSYQNALGAIACLQCEPGPTVQRAVLSLPCPGGMRMNKSLPVMSREEDCIVCPIGTSCPWAARRPFPAVPAPTATSSGRPRAQAVRRAPMPTPRAPRRASSARRAATAPRSRHPAALQAGLLLQQEGPLACLRVRALPRRPRLHERRHRAAPCSPGTIAPAIGLGSCEPCQPGTFQPDWGGVSCLGCGAGNYSANILSCEPCQVGECNPIRSASTSKWRTLAC